MDRYFPDVGYHSWFPGCVNTGYHRDWGVQLYLGDGKRRRKTRSQQVRIRGSKT